MGKERVSIYSIAKEAGVSPATVSRVLTGNANVRAEKKARVEELIRKYDFKPNALARGLSNTESKIMGCLIPDIRNPFYATLAVECERAANERGYSLMLSNYLSDMKIQEQQLQKMSELRTDAVIVIGGKVDRLISDEDYVEKMNQVADQMPVVITGKLDGCECYQVSIDQVQAIDVIMEYLVSSGHRKIALIGGHKDVYSTYIKRVRYKNCLRKYGIPFVPEYVVETGEYSIESGYKAMNDFFKSGVKLPTAVIAINDFSALGIMQSIHAHGYRIPEDISVVSFDDTFLAESSSPRLTSVGYRYDRFGDSLIETAIAAIEGKEPPRLQLVPTQLSIRESSKVIWEEE